MSALGRFMDNLGRGWRDEEIKQLRLDALALRIENEALRALLADVALKYGGIE